MFYRIYVSHRPVLFCEIVLNILTECTHEYLILIKFRNDSAKIVDFLIKAYFQIYVVFFSRQSLKSAWLQLEKHFQACLGKSSEFSYCACRIGNTTFLLTKLSKVICSQSSAFVRWIEKGFDLPCSIQKIVMYFKSINYFGHSVQHACAKLTPFKRGQFCSRMLYLSLMSLFPILHFKKSLIIFEKQVADDFFLLKNF